MNPVMTDDPVSCGEIAERCGVSLERAHYWSGQGQLGDPNWLLGKTPVWAWGEVSKCQIVAELMGTADWSKYLKVPAGRRLMRVNDVEKCDVVSLERRIERHDLPAGLGLVGKAGWVSFPRRGGLTSFFTDDLSEKRGRLVSVETVDGQLLRWAAGMAELRRGGDSRSPKLSKNWR